MSARVVVLAGPSGSGKSRLAARLGLTVLRLDDFYRDGDDPALPRLPDGLVDWDDPASWLHDEAVAAIVSLCETGRAEVPVYEIARNGRTGTQTISLDGDEIFVAEGIFAQEIVADCLNRGLLAGAYVLTQHPAVTFWRRLVRDLREHRKPPSVLVTRGLRLAREQDAVVQHAVRLGCSQVSPKFAEKRIRALRNAPTR